MDTSRLMPSAAGCTGAAALGLSLAVPHSVEVGIEGSVPWQGGEGLRLV